MTAGHTDQDSPPQVFTCWHYSHSTAVASMTVIASSPFAVCAEYIQYYCMLNHEATQQSADSLLEMVPYMVQVFLSAVGWLRLNECHSSFFGAHQSTIWAWRSHVPAVIPVTLGPTLHSRVLLATGCFR